MVVFMCKCMSYSDEEILYSIIAVCMLGISSVNAQHFVHITAEVLVALTTGTQCWMTSPLPLSTAMIVVLELACPKHQWKMRSRKWAILMHIGIGACEGVLSPAKRSFTLEHVCSYAQFSPVQLVATTITVVTYLKELCQKPVWDCQEGNQHYFGR